MKKSILLFLAVAAMTFVVGCQSQGTTASCHVTGTVPDSVEDGVCIIFEPFDMSITSVQPDTVEVKNGIFEVTLDSFMLYKVMPAEDDYYLLLQPLLIVSEPGEVWINLGKLSHFGGTVQNDTLEQWKTLTEAYTRNYNYARSMANSMTKKGDKAMADFLNKKADSLQVDYRVSVQRLAEGISEGPLYDFLSRFFAKE